MINLTEDMLIATGCHKATYLHPEDETKCIKIEFDKDSGEIKQLKREIKYNLTLQKKYSDLPEVAKYRGMVETNLGTGYVWDLVRDADGTVSLTLENCIRDGVFLQDKGKELKRALLELRSAMLKKTIVPMGLHPRNMLCQNSADGRVRLVLVDDIGTASLIPVEYHLPFAARMRIRRHWNRMLDGAMKSMHDVNAYRKILSEIRL